jgi:NDP-sugar pyrophosphorylase family protein
MRPYTDDRPKAMIEVAGVPIIEHQIRWLALNGVKQIVVSCGYKASVLEAHLGDGSRLDVSVAYAKEDEPLGRGGGLKFAAQKLPEPDKRWLALNGDVLAGFSLTEFAEHHQKLGTTATVALAPYKTTWGIADLEGDLIRGFEQSPTLPYWINAGIYALEAEIIPMLPDKGDHEDSTFPDLARDKRLGGYKIKGYWRGIDTVKDLKTAAEELGSA